MAIIKEIKSIELSSYTTTKTLIDVLFSIISAVVISLSIAIFAPGGASIITYLIPTIVVGTFMCGIYNNFSQGLFYNLLAKKLKTIAIAINDSNEIVKISTTETATMIAIIMTIEIILFYLVSTILLPLLMTSVVQTFMYTGQESMAFAIYQFLGMISQPTTIIMLILGTFIIIFVFSLFGAYIYNFVAKTGRGVVVSLSENNGMTSVDSVDALKLAIMFAIISGILSLISGIISLISGANFVSFIGNVLGGFIVGFIEFYLIGLFYNFLAPKIGKFKIELIDYKIN